MSPTVSLDLASQDATSGAAPSHVSSMGSGGDDRPSENICLDFGRIDDKTSNVQGKSSGDDRPSENISLNFGRIDDKTSHVQDTGTDGGDRPTEGIGFSFAKPPEPKPAMASSPESGGADDFVFHPGAADEGELSGLLDFSGIGDDAGAEDEEFLAFSGAAAPQTEGGGATLPAFEAAYADPNGDRIEDIVTAPRPVEDDFIA
ncbi:hypothetical protein [Ancylobacter sp. IITR112]|uniref:hypothetical protein n=1 Tax=Ancylobacter sp. IITR112 TaxID=3138073 RepID=UPI00352A4567